jgi:hypothetical protein
MVLRVFKTAASFPVNAAAINARVGRCQNDDPGIVLSFLCRFARHFSRLGQIVKAN